MDALEHFVLVVLVALLLWTIMTLLRQIRIVNRFRWIRIVCLFLRTSTEVLLLLSRIMSLLRTGTLLTLLGQIESLGNFLHGLEGFLRLFLVR